MKRNVKELFEKLKKVVGPLEDGDVEELFVSKEEFDELKNFIIKNGVFKGYLDEEYGETFSLERARLAYYDVGEYQFILCLESEVITEEMSIRKTVSSICMFNNRGGELDIQYE